MVRRQARTQSDPASKRGPVPEHRQGSPFVLDLPRMLVLDEKPSRFTGSQRMSSKRNRVIKMPAPHLRRIWLEPSRITNRKAYPVCLPLLPDHSELSLVPSLTIIVGENGTCKSTLLQ